jgi:hypothetical protein
MYSMMEGVEHGLHYSSSPTSFLHAPPLTSTASILNLSSEFSIASVPAPGEQQHQFQQPHQSHEYKTEPSTPSCPSQETTYSSFPTPFTPSPSSSGCESPNTPGPVYNFFASSLHHEATDPITISFPAPTPPLSASHQSKEVSHHRLADSLEAKSQSCSFTDEQVDCICDNLQQRMDVEMLGELTPFLPLKGL